MRRHRYWEALSSMCSIRLHIRVIWHISTMVGLGRSKICTKRTLRGYRFPIILPPKPNRGLFYKKNIFRTQSRESINRGLQRDKTLLTEPPFLSRHFSPFFSGPLRFFHTKLVILVRGNALMRQNRLLGKWFI